MPKTYEILATDGSGEQETFHVRAKSSADAMRKVAVDIRSDYAETDLSEEDVIQEMSHMGTVENDATLVT